jgi:hypothetical protein
MWQSDQLREMIHPILVGHPDRSDEEGKVAYFAVVGGDTAFSSKKRRRPCPIYLFSDYYSGDPGPRCLE